MSSAAVQNLSIEAGTSFERTLRFYTDKERTVLMDLTGYTLASQIRSGSVVIDVGLEITDAENGTVKLTVEPSDTEDVKPGKYPWDMLAVAPSGKITKYTKGIAEILKTETQLA
jgi:hypothetical protein